MVAPHLTASNRAYRSVSARAHYPATPDPPPSHPEVHAHDAHTHSTPQHRASPIGLQPLPPLGVLRRGQRPNPIRVVYLGHRPRCDDRRVGAGGGDVLLALAICPDDAREGAGAAGARGARAHPGDEAPAAAGARPTDPTAKRAKRAKSDKRAGLQGRNRLKGINGLKGRYGLKVERPPK